MMFIQSYRIHFCMNFRNICPGSPHHAAATDAIDVQLSHDNKPTGKDTGLAGEIARGDAKAEVILDNREELHKPNKTGAQTSPRTQNDADKPRPKLVQKQLAENSQSQKSVSNKSGGKGGQQQIQPTLKGDAQLAMLDNQLRNILKTGREEVTSSLSERKKEFGIQLPGRSLPGLSPQMNGPMDELEGEDEDGQKTPQPLENRISQTDPVYGARTDGVHYKPNKDEKPLDRDEDDKDVCFDKADLDKPIRIEDEDIRGHNAADMPKISMPAGEGDEDEDGDRGRRVTLGSAVEFAPRPYNGSIIFGGVEGGSMTTGNVGATSVYVDENATRAAPYTLASQFNVSMGSSEEDDAGVDHSGKWPEVVLRQHGPGHSPCHEKRRSIHNMQQIVDNEERLSGREGLGLSYSHSDHRLSVPNAAAPSPLSIEQDANPKDNVESEPGAASNGETEKLDYDKVNGQVSDGSLPERFRQDFNMLRTHLTRSGSHSHELGKENLHIRVMVAQSRSMDSIGDKSETMRTKLQSILKRADSEHSALSGDKSRHDISEHSRSRKLDSEYSHSSEDRGHRKTRITEPPRSPRLSEFKIEDRGAADGESPRQFLGEVLNLANGKEVSVEDEDIVTPVEDAVDKVTQDLEKVAQTLRTAKYAGVTGPTLSPMVRDALRLDLDFDRDSAPHSLSDSAKPNCDALSARDSSRSDRDPLSLQVAATQPRLFDEGHLMRASLDVGMLGEDLDNALTPRPPPSPASRKAVKATAAR